MNTNQDIVAHIVQFLNAIDICVVEKELTEDTFLPGLQIKAGVILMDSKKLKYPGDILHEAGHIATTEAEFRPLIGTSNMAVDWPTDGGEIATILWSYAASRHLKLDANIVFHPHGYKNESEWLIEQFNTKNYIGLPILVWMSLCRKDEFPQMIKWLR